MIPEPTDAERPREQLVFLHGLGQTPQSWQDQVTAVPPDLAMSAPWLRGLRPGKDADFTLADAAGEISANATGHGLERLYLCGSALGALVALQVALDDDRVAGLILSACPVSPPAWALRMQRLAVRAAPAKRLAEHGMDKRAALRALDAMAQADLAGRLPNLTVPTLVITGVGDRSSAAAAEQLIQAVTSARHLVLPAGEVPNEEAPEEFNEAMVEFLAELRDPARSD